MLLKSNKTLDEISNIFANEQKLKSQREKDSIV